MTPQEFIIEEPHIFSPKKGTKHPGLGTLTPTQDEKVPIFSERLKVTFPHSDHNMDIVDALSHPPSSTR